MLADFHVHTAFCDGRDTPEEMVRAAIRKNMVSVGISDHSFTACDSSYCMKLEDYSAYCNEVNLLKEEYKEKLLKMKSIKNLLHSVLRGMKQSFFICVLFGIREGIARCAF